MSIRAPSQALAAQTRRLYGEHLERCLPGVGQAVLENARLLADKPAENAVRMRRRDTLHALVKGADIWQRLLCTALRHLQHTVPSGNTRPGTLGQQGGLGLNTAPLSLVDDDTIDKEILTSRLSLAIMDKASWEFADLRSRVASLDNRAELDANDFLRANILARQAVEVWRQSNLTLDHWRDVQSVIQKELAALVEEAYHEANSWLLSQGVMPEVDLRPFIRRTGGVATQLGSHTHFSDSELGPESRPAHLLAARAFAPTGFSGSGQPGGGGAPAPAARPDGSGSGGGGGIAAVDALRSPRVGADGKPTGWANPQDRPQRGVGLAGIAPQSPTADRVGDETRLMTRAGPIARGSQNEHAEAVLGRLNRLVGRHLPTFARTAPAQPMSSKLSVAIDAAQNGLRQRGNQATQGGGEAHMSTPGLLAELNQRRQQLKAAASSPEERATIEIVALLFQSILTEERIPTAMRVWFARLQMPVLRVAVSEPDFFATTDHPARRLIDRMGACVMGFDASKDDVGDTLDREVKRIVQVVEAYPDTGRRVFQTVLTEFEKFLDSYLSSRNEATRKAVSLAQQVEQRETLAIQFTIELRKMLNEMPVQDGVRQFLFQVWADVLATGAVRYGPLSDQSRALKRVAADLIWSASAKVSREERAEVIRRLPPLLKALREGMASAGLDNARQEEQIRQLNNSLAAAFTAKTAVIPQERLNELMERLETLEEMMPDEGNVVIDESMVIDISDHESSGLEVVAEGGSMPTDAMLGWARELQAGNWFMLDYRGRNEPVQLAWQGMRKQLSLFVTAKGRCVLFPQHRLASFLQAGLLIPAQDESLTVRATRDALAKLDGDPTRLLN